MPIHCGGAGLLGNPPDFIAEKMRRAAESRGGHVPHQAAGTVPGLRGSQRPSAFDEARPPAFRSVLPDRPAFRSYPPAPGRWKNAAGVEAECGTARPVWVRARAPQESFASGILTREDRKDAEIAGSVSVFNSIGMHTYMPTLNGRPLRVIIERMPTKHPKRPRDPNQLAKLIVDIASGAVIDDRPEPPTPAQEFARSGGLKGGDARAKALSPEQRREIARKAAAKRWAAR